MPLFAVVYIGWTATPRCLIVMRYPILLKPLIGLQLLRCGHLKTHKFRDDARFSFRFGSSIQH